MSFGFDSLLFESELFYHIYVLRKWDTLILGTTTLINISSTTTTATDHGYRPTFHFVQGYRHTQSSTSNYFQVAFKAVDCCLITFFLTSRVLLWDIVIFLPNMFFALFLLVSWLRVREKMNNLNFPILSVFYNLILMASLLSMVRCVVTTFIKPTSDIGITVNKVAWLVVRYLYSFVRVHLNSMTFI